MLSAVISSILSYPALQLALQPVHQWYVQPGPLVLGSTPLNSSTRIADRDRTVSRRSEPSSRTTLIGEQPNPWDLLQPQDVMSRHRGAKHCRRYELLGSKASFSFYKHYYLENHNKYEVDIFTIDQIFNKLKWWKVNLLKHTSNGIIPLNKYHHSFDDFNYQNILMINNNYKLNLKVLEKPLPFL